ncbi:MAG TPA: hypothetical protein VGK58_14385 [Lacipirellulaceae bacterium]
MTFPSSSELLIFAPAASSFVTASACAAGSFEPQPDAVSKKADVKNKQAAINALLRESIIFHQPVGKFLHHENTIGRKRETAETIAVLVASYFRAFALSRFMN